VKRVSQQALLAVQMLVVGTAAAHGFGQRYDLPVPLWLYLTGAGATVAVSFALMAWFGRGRSLATLQPPSLSWHLRGPASSAVLAIARVIAAAVYLLVIGAGFIGSQNSLNNIAPAMVWAIWWVGFAYASALIGNLWPLINPLVTLWAWGKALGARWAKLRPSAQSRALPAWLGVWPAVILFLAFNWTELVWDRSDVPANVAAAVVAYSALTWLGLWRFGRQWLLHGEVFTLVFGIFARFAPIDIGVRDRVSLALRPYGVGLLVERPLPLSMIMMVLAMLAAVSFDGFIETPAWVGILDAFGADAPGVSRDAWVLTLGLISAPLIFAAVYFGVCGIIARIGGQGDTLRVAGLFVLTLVPIAIAYHVAHYLSLLVMAGQYLIPLASDPFGWGWDLFGGGTWLIRPGLIGARMLWITAVGAIVIGHVAAIYLAHRQARHEFRSPRTAVASQIPMLALMIGYTMSSLWIIAQPIVSSR
jgi:hypothetical protein